MERSSWSSVWRESRTVFGSFTFFGNFQSSIVFFKTFSPMLKIQKLEFCMKMLKKKCVCTMNKVKGFKVYVFLVDARGFRNSVHNSFWSCFCAKKSLFFSFPQEWSFEQEFFSVSKFSNIDLLKDTKLTLLPWSLGLHKLSVFVEV